VVGCGVTGGGIAEPRAELDRGLADAPDGVAGTEVRKGRITEREHEEAPSRITFATATPYIRREFARFLDNSPGE
jgi:hypothetical protein